MGINLSDYNKAGIFIEERNASAVDNIPAQEAIVNFVPGFSKKGTVFNRPVLMKNKTDRFNFFGDIDRVLEKKGDYFQRTIDIALQTGPVWGMNLLKTNSLDLLNYASVSVSAQFDNAEIATSEYDTFFNKSGFWTRDTESFLFFANNTQRMIHFTNMSDKKITVFMFKSPAQGFDITAETWYGGSDKVPTWMSRYDLMSDFMVRVLVVSGDWSNYVTLATDSNWSKYFNSAGLRTDKVDSFVSDRGVTVLGLYDGSLIPYFKDANNRNIFIESLINADTDKTGLYCAYDTDKVETDYANGKVDIIGQTLVDLNKSRINFMSYQDSIQELESYDDTPLDSLGNVIGIGTVSSRTTTNTNGILSGLTLALTNATTATPTVTISSSSGYAIINNTKKLLTSSTYVPTLPTMLTPSSNSDYKIDTIYLDQNGNIAVDPGAIYNAASGSTINTSTEVISPSLSGLTYPSTLPNNAIVLGYVFREALSGGTFATDYVPIALDLSGYVPLTIGSGGSNDIVVASTSNNVLDITFNTTATALKNNYKAWRRILFFNELVTKKVLQNSVIIDSAGAKVDLSTAIWTDNYTSGSGDKNITLTVATGSNIRSASAAGDMAFYYVDNEFVTDADGLETRDTITGTSNYGIVAKQSKMYLDFYNGLIKTGDYFYVKILEASTSVKFVHYTNTSYPSSVGDYVIFSTADASTLGLGIGSNNLHILVESHPTNTGDFLLQVGEDNSGSGFAPGLVADGFLGAGEIAFATPQLTSTYTTSVSTNIFDYAQKLYLKMYFVGSTLEIDFMSDNALTTTGSIPGGLLSINTGLKVYSGEASFEQTIELAIHNAYTITDTKILIDSTRYPEVKVGDYLKAYIDNSSLQVGEYPKKYARIIKKSPWSGNTTYSVNYQELTTDVKIDIEIFNSGLNYQTTRYTTIEDYVDTYKAIALSGFTVQTTSVPDGTETRQSEILDIIGKGTALYNALVNKNKFNFRYLIDCWGNGLTEFSKQQLADITGKRKNCISFLNMPSAKAFKNSTNPTFINDDGTLNLDFVRQGGDPASNPAFLYSFAQGSGKDDGRDTSGYFFPYVTIDDNGRPLSFPPAAYVANTYMRKVNSNVSGTYPWTIAAGILDGRILGIGNVEMDFTDDDLKALYKMGANPINYAKNTGFYIETEWTASLAPISALSYLHVREILIELENELYAMLLKYQWKFNTPAIRSKIKREADDICQSFVDRSALEAFRNVIDETNNTPVLIDNQFGLLETYVVPLKGMGIIVNVINALPTGALNGSTGFTTQ